MLYTFKGAPSDGSLPFAGLIFDKDDALYGTTYFGGSGCQLISVAGCGTVFKLTPSEQHGKMTWTESVLYNFKGAPSDSGFPYARLIFGREGALYGTTYFGGSGNCSPSGAPPGCGTVFKLTPPAPGQTIWTESVLYSFKGGTDGVNPVAGVIGDANGALYGTTLNGGIGGTVFKLTPPAPGQTIWTEGVLYSFESGTDGNGPAGGLIADTEGALYGTTYSGGSSTNCANNNGCGTVFKLSP